MTTEAEHWEKVYERQDADQVSWFEARPERSLALIEGSGVSPTAPIVDVGGGASRLAAELVSAGHRDVTVADISPAALAQARQAAGAAAEGITFLEADVTSGFQRSYALWHDRAVFHFLLDPMKRAAYLRSLENSLVPGGWVVLATFGPQGPTSCSGLPVGRYDSVDLARLLGPGYELVEASELDHKTPGGSSQHFIYTLFSRVG